uniref:Uncharacterized protein n=1 Tax=viral metagenome TaxID=1070528 RepID=A0A6H1ZQP3_9ZZZZ
MRRYLFVAILFFALGLFFLSWLIVANAHADPYLICDPQLNVTFYVVTVDGNTSTVPAFDLGDGTVRLNFDLAGITEGEHTCSIKAGNAWGESVSVPFVFTRAKPDVPGNVRIQ